MEEAGQINVEAIDLDVDCAFDEVSAKIKEPEHSGSEGESGDNDHGNGLPSTAKASTQAATSLPAEVDLSCLLQSLQVTDPFTTEQQANNQLIDSLLEETRSSDLNTFACRYWMRHVTNFDKLCKKNKRGLVKSEKMGYFISKGFQYLVSNEHLAAKSFSV